MTKKKFHIVIVDDEPNYRTKLAARLAAPDIRCTAFPPPTHPNRQYGQILVWHRFAAFPLLP